MIDGPYHPAGKTTGKILVSRGLISERELDEALELQKRCGILNSTGHHPLIGMIICRLNLITAVDLFDVLHRHDKLYSIDNLLLDNFSFSIRDIEILKREALAARRPFHDLVIKKGIISLSRMQKIIYALYNIPFKDLKKFTYPPNSAGSFFSILDCNECMDNGVIPLAIRDSTLMVGITDPFSMAFVADLNRRVVHYRFNPICISTSRFRALSDQLMKKSSPVVKNKSVVDKDLEYVDSKIVAFIGGGSGAGTTSVIFNLALKLSSEGRRIAVFTADSRASSRSNLKSVCSNGLSDVISGKCRIEDIIISGAIGVDIIPYGDSFRSLGGMNVSDRARLGRASVSMISYDYIFFDISLEDSIDWSAFCRAAHEIVLVFTDDPQSIADASFLVKQMVQFGYDRPVITVLNRAGSPEEARRSYSLFSRVLDGYSGISSHSELAGIIPFDTSLQDNAAVMIGETPVAASSGVSSGLDSLAEGLLSRPVQYSMPLEIFWERCFELVS